SPQFCSMPEPAWTSVTAFSKAPRLGGHAGGGGSRWRNYFWRAAPILSKRMRSRGQRPALGLKKCIGPRSRSCFVPPEQVLPCSAKNDRRERAEWQQLRPHRMFLAGTAE